MLFKTTKLLLLATITVSYIGCASVQNVRNDNRENVNKLAYGISKQKVLEIMGNETANTFMAGKISNPYRTEMYKYDGKIIEILFYFTDIKKADNAITDDELTPIVIIDGKVDGWGWMYWNSLVKKYEFRVR